MFFPWLHTSSLVNEVLPTADPPQKASTIICREEKEEVKTRADEADEKEAEEAVRVLLELLAPTLVEACMFCEWFCVVGDRDSTPVTAGCDEDIHDLSIQELIENRASTPNIDLKLGEPHFSSLISDMEPSVAACFNNGVCVNDDHIKTSFQHYPHVLDRTTPRLS